LEEETLEMVIGREKARRCIKIREMKSSENLGWLGFSKW